MRVFTHWNRLLRDAYVVSILGNIKKHNWTQLWATWSSWPCFENTGWARWPPEIPSNFNFPVIPIRQAIKIVGGFAPK